MKNKEELYLDISVAILISLATILNFVSTSYSSEYQNTLQNYYHNTVMLTLNMYNSQNQIDFAESMKSYYNQSNIYLANAVEKRDVANNLNLTSIFLLIVSIILLVFKVRIVSRYFK